MSTTRWIIETACGECGRFHLEAMLKPGGDPESSIAYCYTRGSRVVVDPDNLPPEAIQRAAKAVFGVRSGNRWDSVNKTTRVGYRKAAEAAVRAFLSDPEQDKQ